jgi:hypothetical protein
MCIGRGFDAWGCRSRDLRSTFAGDPCVAAISLNHVNALAGEAEAEKQPVASGGAQVGLCASIHAVC